MLHSGDDCDDDELDALSTDDFLDIADESSDPGELWQEYSEETFGSGDEDGFLAWRMTNYGY